MSEQVNKR